MPADIDVIKPTRGLIDLSSTQSGDFGLDDFKLKFLFDDIILVEYIDMTETGEVMRGGIYIPSNALTKAWRKAVVILAGPDVKYVKKGDIVVFPNNLGVTVANMEITGHGKISNGIFLNESRVFGICERKD